MAYGDTSALRATFRGELVRPGDGRYDELRSVFNAMTERRPAVIARCLDAADVAAAVNFGRDRGLPVAVYGGGHGVTGHAVCDDGIVVDLRPMKGISIDPRARRGRAAAGLTWGEFDAATQEYRLAVTGGRVSTTGIGGLVLGSGSGWIERKHGYTADNLLSVQIVTADGRIRTASATDAVSGPVRGQPVVGVVVSYAGPPEDGEKALAPLREFGPPAADLVQPMPYVALQRLIDDGNPKGMRHYWSADFLTGLPDEAIETICERHLTAPSPHSQILVIPGGGAIARIPEDRMAFGQRQAPFNLHILSVWQHRRDDEANIAWAREFGTAVKPFTTGRAYLNFIGDEGEGRVRAAFGPQAYARLQALKDRYDPQNLFRLNQNIKPSVVRTGSAA